MRHSERRDTQRLAAAIVAAVLVHAGLFVGIPYLTSLDTAPMPDYGPVVIRVELPEAVLEPPPPVVVPVPAPQPAPTAKPAPAPKPAAKAAPAPKVAAASSSSALEAPVTPTRAAGTSAFRQAGSTTGVSAETSSPSVTTGPPPVQLPPAGISTAGSGQQRSGEGTLVTSRPTGGTGTIDTNKLAQSLVAASTGGATGATGTSGGTAAATGAKPGPGATVVWEDSTAGKGREYQVPPKVDLTKSALDFLNGVRIEFRVDAEGLVTPIRVVQSSGRADVDKACWEAMLKARFTPVKGAPQIKGTQLFTPDFGR